MYSQHSGFLFTIVLLEKIFNYCTYLLLFWPLREEDESTKSLALYEEKCFFIVSFGLNCDYQINENKEIESRNRELIIIKIVLLINEEIIDFKEESVSWSEGLKDYWN